jgi:amino acid transporter
MADAGTGSTAEVGERPRLREGSVGLWGDFIAAVTNVAPSAAVALTLGSIIAVSGLATPLLVVIVGLAMLCIAFAYHHLNLWQPSPAAQVMWIARAAAPVLGFAAGILLILESTVSNIANISLMGPYLLGIFSSDAASNPILEYLTSLIIMAIVCAIAIIGIRAAISFQTWILWIEYGIMLIFALVIYYADFTGSSGAHAPSLSWFTPGASPTGASGLVSGIVITVFMFGGWEAAVYLGEEQREAHRDPGRSAIICVIFCTVWFAFLIFGVQGVASAKDLTDHSSNILAFAAGRVLPHPLDAVVSLAVLSSLIAVVQAQLNAWGRVAFGMAREGTIPRQFALLGKAQTPWFGLVFAAAIPMVLLVFYLANSAIAGVLAAVTATAGYLYAVLYIVVAATCIWYYRRTLGRSASQLFYAGILPAIGALFLIYCVISGLVTAPTNILIPSLIFIFIGIPAALVAVAVAKTDFWHTSSIAAEVSSTAGGTPTTRR